MNLAAMNAFNLSDRVWTDKLGEVIITDHQSHHSSDGNLEKWRVELQNGDSFWLKSSSVSISGDVLYECESECIASRLAYALGLPNVVNYDMDTLHIGDKSIKVCSSKEFEENNLVYYAEILPGINRLTGKDKYDVVNGFDPALEAKLQSVLLFDILIGNGDRHLHNLALDVEKREFLIFDNGAGLLSFSTTDSLRFNLKVSFGYHKCRPFFDTVSRQIQLIDKYQFNQVSQSFVRSLVDDFLDKKRAKLIKSYLLNNFRKVGEYFEFPVFKE